jgi:hypothetical protein
MAQNVSTPQGDVSLIDPPIELLQSVRRYMPFGAARYLPPQANAEFGLVMQCGDRECHFVKQQPTDCDKKQAYVSYQCNSLLIAHSLLEYRRFGYKGLFMPCAYLKEKEGGLFESGLAYFGTPSPEGIECLDRPYEPGFDDSFGHGFTTMMASFIYALHESSRATGISIASCVGLDVRARSDLQTLGFGFLIIGQDTICLKTHISGETDPVWTILRATGITEIYHMPSIPSEISEEQLAVTKDARDVYGQSSKRSKNDV